jgi:hypothetical protein
MFGIELKESEEIIDVVYSSMLLYIRSVSVAVSILVATSYTLFWLLEQGLWGQIVAVSGYVIGVLLIVRMYIYWRGSALVITTERVFGVHKESLFHTDITQIRFRDIDDVVGNFSGFWGTVFRLGEVHIYSKRNDMSIRVTAVRKPLVIQDRILDQVDVLEQSHSVAILGKKEVLAYMTSLSVTELDAVIRNAMEILRKKKEM